VEGKNSGGERMSSRGKKIIIYNVSKELQNALRDYGKTQGSTSLSTTARMILIQFLRERGYEV